MAMRAAGRTGESVQASRRITGGSCRAVAAVGLALLVAACAPLTEQELYEREHRLNLAKEKYAQVEAACHRSGGSMQMARTPLSKTERHDYKTARCVRY